MEGWFRVGDLPLGSLASASTNLFLVFPPNALVKLHCQDMLSKEAFLGGQDLGHTERLCTEPHKVPVSSLPGKKPRDQSMRSEAKDKDR